MQGSIRQRGPSSWQVRVCTGRDPASGRYRYVSRTVEGNKRTAWLARMIATTLPGLLGRR